MKWRLIGNGYITISLLFFAAFGADKISNQTIEEYMENLVSEEQGSRGT